MTDSSFSNETGVHAPPGGLVSDAGRRRRRKVLFGAGAAVVAALLVGGGVWLAVGGGSDDSAQQVPVLPSSFSGYKKAKAGDTEWSQVSVVNTDITKGQVYLTYRAPGGRALIIRAQYVPDATLRPTDPSDPLYGIYNTTIDQSRVQTYSAGAVGGKVKCADVIAGATTFTTCGWHNDKMNVALAPMRNHSEIVSAEAPAYLRSFINALHLTRQK